ncbi:glycoside hydrolase family 2 TIM barrel-domain containing protein [Algibacter sp. AS12]|uniref:glycoside hydrolase family 2 TIM barrel-domain containing protein n=1 Tax=Algibacter sp. AS12 TaxID=3135773 RepID=UPI00398A7B29
MKKYHVYLILSIIFLTSCSKSQSIEGRLVETLKTDWKFTKGDVEKAETLNFDDANWETVRVPHDWAIYGPFDKKNDAQGVKVHADGEKKKKLRLGRTAGLPHIGIGWYRKTFKTPDNIKDKKLFVEFDGAMSHAQVYVNGEFVGEWPYGYSSFHFDISRFITKGENTLAVRLENKEQSSRWYPGAGIYRNVRLVYTDKAHVKHWGTYITTPKVTNANAEVHIKTSVLGQGDLTLLTEIYNSKNELITKHKMTQIVSGESEIAQTFKIDNPDMWSIETPLNYKVLSKVIKNEKEVDVYKSTFGIRNFEFTIEDGFHLNGKRVQIQGVCMHHDLGPLGTAINVSALKRQLDILKGMGCNAIRTSHNSPAPELLKLCDEMGFIVMDEAFDEWKKGKNKNGYMHLWDEWAEKDLVSLIHRDRNHPSIFMWSVGNEILEQFTDEGWEKAKFLVDIAHREDSTRPVTIGMNKEAPAENNFAAQFDVKGWNYHTHLYPWLKEKHPDWKFIASETQSTVASRGYFDLDTKPTKHYRRDNMQCSDYALDYCNWSNTPDVGFAMLDDNPHVAGEFVWTGFDYLGEPSPYNIEWPTKNSYFGIVDLAGFPKSMYYMYKARWTDEDVLHILPHWNWDANEVKTLPVHVFTNFDSAELFVNGKSQGIRTKNPKEVYERYRLVWNDVPYEAGEVKVIALNANGKPAMENSIKTALEPFNIKLTNNYSEIKADGESLTFVEVDIIDKDGNFCPLADSNITFTVEGEGVFEASGNGNSTDITSFQSNQRKAFNGKCLAIIRSTGKPGKIVVKASSEGLKSSEIEIDVVE